MSALIDCLESDLNIKSKISVLNSLINVQGLELEIESEVALVKNKIKEFCSDAAKRSEGLLLLYAIVHSSSTLYVDNWCQIVLGSLKCTDSVISREIPLKVLNRTLKNFGRDSDYTDVFAKVIPEILPFLLKPDDVKVYVLSLQSLAVCMKYAPEITFNQLPDIEELLLRELDNPYGEVIEAVGDCFAAYPMCLLHKKRASLEYKNIWCNVFTKFLNTTHVLLNCILRLREDQKEYVSVSDPVFDLPALQSNSIPVTQIDVFKSLCLCMAKMMSSDNYLVHLPVAELLETLFRVFDVEKLTKSQNQDSSIPYIKLGFSQMLNGIFVVLEALVVNFQIIDQSHNFLILMNMTLNALDETYSRSSVSQVRGSVWKLINVWLKQYGSKASDELAKNKSILEEILADIEIEEKKNTKSKVTNNIKDQNKVFVCTQALKALKTLLEVSGCFMEKNALDKVISTLLRVSRQILRNISPRKKFPCPYSEEVCRKMLYKVLHTYVLYGDPLHNKCITEAINIFHVASKDTSRKVAQICHRFRRLSRYYLNPKKPPPDAIQYSHPKMLNAVQQPVIESIRAEWGDGIEWNSANGPSSDDQMEEGEISHVQVEMDNENDLMPVDHMEETETHKNHGYRRKSSQSVVEEESIDDSDIEPTYVSTHSNPQRISINNSHVNSFEMQSCGGQYSNGTRTERHVSETGIPNMTNNVENNIEEEVSAFVEVKSAAQKPPQAPVGNGEWKKKENATESDEDDSDIEEEEGDEEVEANEEMSDNGADEASDGKRSPEFDEERPSKRQKCIEEEVDEDVDEDVEDEVNNQSSDEERNEVNNVPVLEQNAGSNSENLNDEESQVDNEEAGCRSPTIKEMCGDFVLAEPTATEIS